MVKGQIVNRNEMVAGKLEKIGEQFLFHCPGCDQVHFFNISGPEPVWTFNGDYVKPTFSPSLMVNRTYPDKRCHSYVRDGQIQFLNDCHHMLKNQTVDLPEWPAGKRPELI